MTHPTIAATTAHAPVRPPRSSRRSFISLGQAISLTAKLFNPNLKAPRPFRIPTRPSLRASQLPPPCAELDERPRRRVRRFMLWNDKVPPLRLVVLDPRKRGHLRRFNVFQIPSNPQPTRGIRTWNGDLRTLRSPPSPAIPTLPRRPVERSTRPVVSSAKAQARVGGIQGPVGSARKADIPVLPRNTTGRPVQSIAPTALDPNRANVADPSGVTPHRQPGAPRLARAPTERPIREMSSTGLVPAQAGGVIAPAVNAPLLPPTTRLCTPAPGRVAPRIRSTPESRRAERAKLLQHRFVLEQQAEKRWRIAMDYMVTKMLIFEAEHTMPSRTNDKPIWAHDPDPAVIIQWIGFMSDFRKWGNIWPHIVLAQRDLPEHEKIKPVKGLNQARQGVKEANRKREETKRVKVAKMKAAQEAKAAAELAMTERQGLIGPISRGAGPAMVIPRTASPVLRVVNPSPTPPRPSTRKSTSRTRTSHRSTDSDTSHSEHLITPTTSNTAKSVEANPVPNDKITPNELRSLGLNAEIPDGIAHHLADMLTKFQAIGLERERGQKEKKVTSARQAISRDGARRKRKEQRFVGELEVSVDSDTSTSSDVSDALTMESGSEKGSKQSWMTGDLNMDEDTKALSGAGTDVGSAT